MIEKLDSLREDLELISYNMIRDSDQLDVTTSNVLTYICGKSKQTNSS